MRECSVLIGGKAGEGINTAGLIIANLFSRLGYRIYMYFDYPSLIRGGHNFCIIRASERKIAAHRETVNVLLALDQNCIDLHPQQIREDTVIIHDTYRVVRPEGHGVALNEILAEEKAPEIARNSAIIGAFCKAAGIEWEVLSEAFAAFIKEKYLEMNLRVAKRAYNSIDEQFRIPPLERERLPVLTGNEATGLGLVRGGLDAFVAYPMTPTSNLLHFLAEHSDALSVKVIHPENEIGVMLMALGLAYGGKKTAACTSGGGFCLMTEGFSLAGMAEMPVTIVVGQRPGPSTGLPTYSSQTEMHFVLNAGQGEFPRLVIAPGDLEESYAWSATALMLSWKYQIPSIVLTDKTLAEGTFSFDLDSAGEIPDVQPLLWDGAEPYLRYRQTESGISPLAFPGSAGAVIKANSYTHDESGITTEEAAEAAGMQDKAMRKLAGLAEELKGYRTVRVTGEQGATAVACWGSQAGVCDEVAERLGLKVIRPLVLSPFPVDAWREAMAGVDKVICVENNATGQLARLLAGYGFPVHDRVLKYDGRPFSVDELEARLAEVIV
jgi:2-oxoglutarate/2-oxoacid ferredoxin oxidoreductase subunit alpha